jgi:hypothetical protein
MKNDIRAKLAIYPTPVYLVATYRQILRYRGDLFEHKQQNRKNFPLI